MLLRFFVSSVFVISVLPSLSIPANAQAVDECLPGKWIMDATELSQFTDDLLKDLPAQLVWKSGQAIMNLNTDGSYINSLEDIDAFMGQEGQGVGVQVTGSSFGSYEAADGKISLHESENTLEMKMTIPGTNQVVDMPIGDNAKTEPTPVNYICTNENMTINFTIEIPESGSREITFNLARESR